MYATRWELRGASTVNEGRSASRLTSRLALTPSPTYTPQCRADYGKKANVVDK